MDYEWSIPSVMDGLNREQRKVIYTCLNRTDKSEVLVSRLIGRIIGQSADYYDERVLTRIIIKLAQNFVGSNNINILLPNGQFGTRLQGGEDAASAGCLYTELNSLSGILFSSLDNPFLSCLYEDNLKIEPLYYAPVIPMALVNGVEVNGAEFSTKVPNFNPREIIDNIKIMLNGQEPEAMLPWYKNFRGCISRLDNQHFLVSGELAILGDNKVEISELPVFTWTESYKEKVLYPMVPGSIIDVQVYYTVTTVRFVISMTAEQFGEAQIQGFHRYFKLESIIDLSNMTLLDHRGCVRKYGSPEEILKEYFEVRFAMYERRKEYIISRLEAEYQKLKNQSLFYLQKNYTLFIYGKKKVEVLKTLVENGFDPDPIKVWEASQNTDEEESPNNLDADLEKTMMDNYSYLLGMPICNSLEAKEELLTKRRKIMNKINDLEDISPSEMWLKDLEELERQLDKVEKEEMDDSILGHGEDRLSPFGERVAPIVHEAPSPKETADSSPVHMKNVDEHTPSANSESDD